MCSRVFLRSLHGLFLVLTTATFAAPLLQPAWSVRSWQKADGLPNNNVLDVTQMPDGFLCVVTYGWVTRFDGVEFEKFDPREVLGPDAKVARCRRSRDGTLWLALES